jgi:GDP-mannose pyrophosphatase NudK
MADKSEIEIVETMLLAQHKGTLTEVAYRRRRSDGADQIVKREVYDNGNSAAILPYDEMRGTVLLTRQFRLPAYLQTGRSHLIEACAGKLDGEDPAVRIVKEAEEELGYRIRKPEKILDIMMSPAGFSEMVSLFIGRYGEADKISSGGGLADEGEDIAVLELPIEEAFKLVSDGKVIDAKTILLLQALKQQFSDDALIR